jgi:hypothetical protein
MLSGACGVEASPLFWETLRFRVTVPVTYQWYLGDDRMNQVKSTIACPEHRGTKGQEMKEMLHQLLKNSIENG